MGLLGLLIAPLVWTLMPILTCTDYTLPYFGEWNSSNGEVGFAIA